jgi:hypothetical protein
MRGLTVHPIYSQDATVYIETGDDQLRTMQRAIDDSGFLDRLEAVYAASKKARADFLIAIKPNIMTASIRQEHSPIYTDPLLVEYLIAQIRAWRSSPMARWREGRASCATRSRRRFGPIAWLSAPGRSAPAQCSRCAGAPWTGGSTSGCTCSAGSLSPPRPTRCSTGSAGSGSPPWPTAARTT